MGSASELPPNVPKVSDVLNRYAALTGVPGLSPLAYVEEPAQEYMLTSPFPNAHDRLRATIAPESGTLGVTLAAYDPSENRWRYDRHGLDVDEEEALVDFVDESLMPPAVAHASERTAAGMAVADVFHSVTREVRRETARRLRGFSLQDLFSHPDDHSLVVTGADREPLMGMGLGVDRTTFCFPMIEPSASFRVWSPMGYSPWSAAGYFPMTVPGRLVLHVVGLHVMSPGDRTHSIRSEGDIHLATRDGSDITSWTPDRAINPQLWGDVLRHLPPVLYEAEASSRGSNSPFSPRFAAVGHNIPRTGPYTT